jgi:hypothetical protein
VTLRIHLGAAQLRRLRQAHSHRLAVIVTLAASDGTLVTRTATTRITS